MDSTGVAPLTARSVLLSLLLGTRPPRARVAQLIRAAELFGIAEGTARTALSRMTATGEVRSVDGRYELADARLLARADHQDRSVAGDTLDWDGRWSQLLVARSAGRSAAARAQLRRRLSSARYAELREGVWTRPANLPDQDATKLIHEAGLIAGSVTWEPRGHATDAQLAASLWDLRGWACVAVELVKEITRVDEMLRGDDPRSLADGFVTNAAVLRHLRIDPLLPTEIRPPGWPGGRLRRTYAGFDARYRAELTRWFHAAA